MTDLIVLCPNPFRDTGLELTLKAKSLLETNGYRTEICPVFGADDPDAIPQNIRISDWNSVSGDAALFVIIGGDGTMLHAARYLNHTDTPMLGINLGTKGFMAPLEPDKLELILDAAAGNYVSSYRMMIDVELKRNDTVAAFLRQQTEICLQQPQLQIHLQRCWAERCSHSWHGRLYQAHCMVRRRYDGEFFRRRNYRFDSDRFYRLLDVGRRAYR